MLEIKNLYKTYGNFTALNGLNITIEKGQLYGFVGPNGAGKTTTIKIIAGLLQADAGEVYIDNENVLYNSSILKEKIGYLPDFFGVYDNLKVIEYMKFYASTYGIEGIAARQACFELLEKVNLVDKAFHYVDTLSRGMKQRLCLARSLIHNPQLLILDEPASGLDPRARYEMKEILKQFCSEGKTILISSHVLSELSELCTGLGIINKGRMIISGTIEEIQMKLHASNPIVIQVLDYHEEAVLSLKRNPLVKNISILGEIITITFVGKEREEANLLSSLIEEGATIASFHREKGNLESLFMEITKIE